MFGPGFDSLQLHLKAATIAAFNLYTAPAGNILSALAVLYISFGDRKILIHIFLLLF